MVPTGHTRTVSRWRRAVQVDGDFVENRVWRQTFSSECVIFVIVNKCSLRRKNI
jgi:hypothetical protein